jgi:hypothetical protein
MAHLQLLQVLEETDEAHCGPVVSLGVRGHEKVLGFGHLRSPLVATKVPAFGHEKSPPQRKEPTVGRPSIYPEEFRRASGHS